MKHTRWIVAAFVLLALGPLVSVRRERAAWKIAAAENAMHQGDMERAEHRLQEAVAVYPDIVQESSYRLAQSRLRSYAKDSQQVYQSLEAFGPELQAELMRTFIEQYLVDQEFDKAIQGLKLLVPDPDNCQNSNDLNQLAYIRALDDSELEAALGNIQRALELEKSKSPEPSPSLLDTRGWVLWRMGRHEEARQDLDQAIEGTYRTLADQLRGATSQSLWQNLPEWLVRPRDSSSDDQVKPNQDGGDSIQNQVDRQLPPIPSGVWATLGRRDQSPVLLRRMVYATLSRSPVHLIAVLRFHRARVLEALGEKEASQEDLDWIHRFGYPDDQFLF
jgi:tetratricopeptide (TPR) repeat protein